MRAAGEAPTRRAELAAAVELLAAAGIPTARVDAEWLLAAVLGVGRFEAQLDLDRVLPTLVAERYEAAVRRRAQRDPLQQVLGWEGFRGLRASGCARSIWVRALARSRARSPRSEVTST